MDPLANTWRKSPTLARVAPFAVFLARTYCQGRFGETSKYWFYAAKTVVGAWFVWSVRPFIGEMRWAISWQAVAAGVGVFAFWVGLDGHYPSLDQLAQSYLCPLLKAIGLGNWCPPSTDGAPLWNPNAQFGDGSALAWMFIVIRIVGSSMVVPPLEEVFYRSFLYRYIIKPDFQAVAQGTFRVGAFVMTSALFGFTHYQWAAGILCGFVYQGVVCWKGRLGDAMTAHAITNLLLGIWVVWEGAWQFW